MRIKRLDLKAFGPFTDQAIDFDSAQPGLHIIFGPNEAGKSSSLRALKALLYGFPERTPDNFLHANDKLLVGGSLEGSKGQELIFLRRKKRKADLLSADGDLLAPDALVDFLHGIEPTLFESLYGIDHKTLVAGGEEILAQKGEVGKALFAAGTGISSLKNILDSLEAEANELFRDRGSKQQINKAIKEYKDLKKVMKDASLQPGKWKENKKRLQAAENEQEQLDKERRQKSTEIQRLERLHKAIPELAELENLQKQLSDLGDVVVLPPEFPDQLQQVEQEIRETDLQLSSHKDRRKMLQSKSEGISLNQTLLDLADTIEDLHQRLGEYRKGKQDRNKLDGMRTAYRHDAGVLIEEVSPDLTLKDADSLRPVLTKKRTIHDLSSRHEALHQQTVQAQKQKQEAEVMLDEIAEKLSNLPDPRENDALVKVIKLAQKAGDIDGQFDKLSLEIESGTKSCQAELKRLGLWTGSTDQLPELPLPLPETVRRFESDFSELDKERQQLRKDRQRAETELMDAKTESTEILYVGEVPSEKDLEAARKKRQEGWQLLRRKWLVGEDIAQEAAGYEPGKSLPDAYEAHVEQADIIADRLRREADRVTKAASLRARIENIETTIQKINQQEEIIANREQDLLEKWQAKWEAAQIKPLLPGEMLAWLTDIDKQRFRVTEIRNKLREKAEWTKTRQQYRKALVEELTNLGESFEFPGDTLAPVLVFAESVSTDITRQNNARERLLDKQILAQKELNKTRKVQEEATVAQIEWQGKWDAALAGLGLKDQILPSEALDLLDTIGSCLDKLEKAREFQSRIDGIDRDVGMFSADVATLLEEAAPDLKKVPLEQAVQQLHTMLGKARQEKEFIRKNDEEIETITEEITRSEKTLRSLNEIMAEFLATAKCDQISELTDAIRKSAEHQRLHEKISNAKSSVAKASEGVPFEDIKQEASAVNIDDLPGQIASLKRQTEEDLDPRIKEALKLVGEESKELQLMDGSGRAAEAAEKMEEVAARIDQLVEQYTKIKLAGTVLKAEIERYREEHQDPILKIASRIFSELTLGSFAGLRTDVDNNGDPVLIGVRPDETRVGVEGMSDGTCDQLYLALRLATLEWRLENSEPMPFIVDDILINFDDERSRATLNALAHLATRNQVILFTHHRQIMNEATQLQDKHPVFIHEL